MKRKNKILIATLATLLLITGCGNSSSTKDTTIINTSTNGLEQQKVFQEFWDIFDRHYPLMHRKGIDWQDVYSTYSPQILSTTTEKQLFNIFSIIMKTIIKDGHTHLSFNDTQQIEFRPNINENIQKMIEMNTPNTVELINKSSNNSYLSYGVLVNDNDIGYILSKQFEPLTENVELEFNAFKTIVDEALLALRYKKGIIIDIRQNHGGQALFAYYLAGRFLLDSPIDVQRSRYKITTGDTESSLSNWVLNSSDDFNGYPDIRAEGGTVASTDSNLNQIDASGAFQYINKVVLLTSKETSSAAEFFTVAMRSQSQIKSIGNTTFGIFAGSELFTFVNGGRKWKLNISVHDTEVIYGNTFQSFEGVGIVPDEKLIPTISEINLGRDIHIESAMTYINL